MAMSRSMLPVSVSRCVGSKPYPVRLAISLVGEALLAQSLKRVEYFLTRLSVRQAGAAVLCRSAGDSIFGENGSHMGVTINAHLFLDRRLEILDQMKTISYRGACGAPSRAAWAYRPQRPRLTTAIVGRACNHAFALSTLRSSRTSTTE